jgi:(S)-ureidoglycine aminohydrolase
MQRLGASRTSYQRGHFLLTPDTFVRAALPGMSKATAIVHAAPAHGAGFTEYTVEFESGGAMRVGAHQTFLYVLEGSVTLADRHLTQGHFAYLPPHRPAQITSGDKSRIIVIEKPFAALGEAPGLLIGDEGTIEPKPLPGDETVEVRTLIPDDFAFDFAVNTMTFPPGASLPMVEAHVMEHGLLMLEGGGIYRLGDHWYPVTAGDFIWMAPYCPQWFGAIGRSPAKYLIYKDWNRHPLQSR